MDTHGGIFVDTHRAFCVDTHEARGWPRRSRRVGVQAGNRVGVHGRDPGPGTSKSGGKRSGRWGRCVRNPGTLSNPLFADRSVM
jgi:hypothetical protein